jgi:acetyl esterase
MPLHQQAALLIQVMDSLDAPPMEEMTPEAARAGRAAQPVVPPEPIHEVRDIDAGGVPARLYRPNDRTDLGLLVYFHGGGWVICDLDTHDGVCRSLANRSGHAVLSIDYRLAPEHPFPAALEDCTNATRWAHANAAALGCRADRVAVGGDSAGGNLAAVVAQLGVVPLVYQLLIYPVTDLTRDQPSYEENATGYFLTKNTMGWFIDHYLSGGGSPVDPRVSPLFAADHVIAATPPALVITAEYDPLRDEGNAYARKLAEAGVPTSHVQYNGMIHAFFSLGDFLDDGRSAQALAGSALASAFNR